MAHKACPFCGGEPTYKTGVKLADFTSKDDIKFGYIQCENCKARSGRLIIAKRWVGVDEGYTIPTNISEEHVWKLWDART